MLQCCQLVKPLQPLEPHVPDLALYPPAPFRDPSQVTTLAQGLVVLATIQTLRAQSASSLTL